MLVERIKRSTNERDKAAPIDTWACLTKYDAMKTSRRSGSIAPRFLKVGCRWRWVLNFTLRSLNLRGKSPRYPLDESLGGPQSRFGHNCEEKRSPFLPLTELYPCRPGVKFPTPWRYPFHKYVPSYKEVLGGGGMALRVLDVCTDRK
jgi:hypothetical protein